MGKESKEIDFSKISDMDLVNIVNQTEGLAWRMNHDASDERIEGDITDSLSELNLYKNQVVEEIKRRTGLGSHEDLRNYVQGKLKEQDNLWDKQWETITKEGTVFTRKKNGESDVSSHVFETVRVYLPVRGIMGPNQYVLTRIHGEEGKFYMFDDREVPQLQILKAGSIYLPKRSGIVKHDERLEQRLDLNSKNKEFHDFTEGGTVFSHVGFNGVFETYGHFNLPGEDRTEENEVIIARPHIPELEVFLYEFIPQDLGAMTKIGFGSKFNRDKNSHFIQLLDMYKD